MDVRLPFSAATLIAAQESAQRVDRVVSREVVREVDFPDRKRNATGSIEPANVGCRNRAASQPACAEKSPIVTVFRDQAIEDMRRLPEIPRACAEIRISGSAQERGRYDRAAAPAAKEVAWDVGDALSRRREERSDVAIQGGVGPRTFRARGALLRSRSATVAGDRHVAVLLAMMGRGRQSRRKTWRKPLKRPKTGA